MEELETLGEGSGPRADVGPRPRSIDQLRRENAELQRLLLELTKPQASVRQELETLDTQSFLAAFYSERGLQSPTVATSLEPDSSEPEPLVVSPPPPLKKGGVGGKSNVLPLAKVTHTSASGQPAGLSALPEQIRGREQETRQPRHKLHDDLVKEIAWRPAGTTSRHESKPALDKDSLRLRQRGANRSTSPNPVSVLPRIGRAPPPPAPGQMPANVNRSLSLKTAPAAAARSARPSAQQLQRQGQGRRSSSPASRAEGEAYTDAEADEGAWTGTGTGAGAGAGAGEDVGYLLEPSETDAYLSKLFGSSGGGGGGGGGSALSTTASASASASASATTGTGTVTSTGTGTATAGGTASSLSEPGLPSSSNPTTATTTTAALGTDTDTDTVTGADADADAETEAEAAAAAATATTAPPPLIYSSDWVIAPAPAAPLDPAGLSTVSCELVDGLGRRPLVLALLASRRAAWKVDAVQLYDPQLLLAPLPPPPDRLVIRAFDPLEPGSSEASVSVNYRSMTLLLNELVAKHPALDIASAFQPTSLEWWRLHMRFTLKLRQKPHGALMLKISPQAVERLAVSLAAETRRVGLPLITAEADLGRWVVQAHAQRPRTVSALGPGPGPGETGAGAAGRGGAAEGRGRSPGPRSKSRSKSRSRSRSRSRSKSRSRSRGESQPPAGSRAGPESPEQGQDTLLLDHSLDNNDDDDDGGGFADTDASPAASPTGNAAAFATTTTATATATATATTLQVGSPSGGKHGQPGPKSELVARAAIKKGRETHSSSHKFRTRPLTDTELVLLKSPLAVPLVTEAMRREGERIRKQMMGEH